MASLCVDVGNSIGIYDAFQERKRQINHYKSRLSSTKKQAKRPPEASGPQTTTTGTTTGTTTTTTTRTASNLIGVGESCKEDKQMVLMIAPPLEKARQQCNMQVRVPFARLVIANDDDDDDDECESIRLQELSALREHNEKEQQMIIKKSKREAPIESPERTTGGCRPAGKVSGPSELSCSLSSLLSSSSSSELDSVCCREISTIKASCVNEAVDGRRGDALSEQDKHRGPSRGYDDDDDMNPMKSDNCCQSASISLANDDKETDTSSSSSLSSFRPSSAGTNTLGAHSIKYESHSQPDYEMNATSGRQTSEHQWGRPRGLPETPARAQASERRNLRANNNNINTTLRHHKLRLPHQHHHHHRRRHNYHHHQRHHHLGWPAIGPTATAALLACLVATLITLTLTNSVEAVDCFKCSSRNGSNPACEDPFHNLNTTRVTTAILPDPSPSVIYHTPCHAGKKGRDGLFPASACIKLTGTFDTTGETLVVRHCALDSGTLTQDTELARMSHCGKFQFEGDLLKGWSPETNRSSGDACKPREATSCSRR